MKEGEGAGWLRELSSDRLGLRPWPAGMHVRLTKTRICTDLVSCIDWAGASERVIAESFAAPPNATALTMFAVSP